MRTFLIILILFLSAPNAIAYNPFWTHRDKRLISELIALDKYDPKGIEHFFRTQNFVKVDTTKENLGFGWTKWSPGIGSGYVSVFASFYYYKDSLISYSLSGEMPEEKALQRRYKKWYKGYFLFSNSTIQPFKFNESALLSPLKEYNGNLKSVSAQLSRYMSPASGTMYGHAELDPFSNVRNFLNIKDSLTTDQVVLLMYSINPASRLVAIDYYYRYRDHYMNQEEIDKWIEINFAEIPVTTAMFGCEEVTVETRSLFPLYYFYKYNHP